MTIRFDTETPPGAFLQQGDAGVGQHIAIPEQTHVPASDSVGLHPGNGLCGTQHRTRYGTRLRIWNTKLIGVSTSYCGEIQLLPPYFVILLMAAI